jgi:hypothetical protein
MQEAMNNENMDIVDAVGLSVAERGINVVHLRRSGQELHVVNAGEYIRPDGDDTDNVEWRTETVRRLISQYKNTETELRCCVPHRYSLARKMGLKFASKEDIPDWLRWAVEKYLPENRGEFVIDFNRIKGNGTGSREYVGIILPGSLNGLIVSSNIGGIEQWNPTVDSLAIYNLALYDGGVNGDKTDILLNIDHKSAAYVLINKGDFAHSGSIDIEGIDRREESVFDLISDLFTAVSYHIPGDLKPGDYSVTIGGDIPENSLLLQTLAGRLTPEVRLFAPFEGISAAEGINGWEGILKKQQVFASAFGTAVGMLNEISETEQEAALNPEQVK